MIRHAFRTVDHIIFYVAKDNIRSQKAIEKLNCQKIPVSVCPELPRKGPDHITFIIRKGGFSNSADR